MKLSRLSAPARNKARQRLKRGPELGLYRADPHQPLVTVFHASTISQKAPAMPTWTDVRQIRDKIVERTQMHVKAAEALAEKQAILKGAELVYEREVRRAIKRNATFRRWFKALDRHAPTVDMPRLGELTIDFAAYAELIGLQGEPDDIRWLALREFSAFMQFVNERHGYKPLDDPWPENLGGYRSDLDALKRTLRIR